MQNNFEIIARAIIMKDNKILLCAAKGADYFFLPGGHIEFGEFSEEALRRELVEELGKEAKSVEFIEVLENIFVQNEKKRHEVNMIFKVEFEDYNLSSAEDHIEFSWHNISDILEVNLLPEIMKEKILGLIKEKNNEKL